MSRITFALLALIGSIASAQTTAPTTLPYEEAAARLQARMAAKAAATVPQADYDALKAENLKFRAQIVALQKQLAALQKQLASSSSSSSSVSSTGDEETGVAIGMTLSEVTACTKRRWSAAPSPSLESEDSGQKIYKFFCGRTLLYVTFSNGKVVSYEKGHLRVIDHGN